MLHVLISAEHFSSVVPISLQVFMSASIKPNLSEFVLPRTHLNRFEPNDAFPIWRLVFVDATDVYLCQCVCVCVRTRMCVRACAHASERGIEPELKQLKCHSCDISAFISDFRKRVAFPASGKRISARALIESKISAVA